MAGRGSMLAGLAVATGCLGIATALAGDPNPAMSRPDQVAWELFTQITRDAAAM